MLVCAWSYALACLSDALIKTMCVAGLVAPGPRLCVCGAVARPVHTGVGELAFEGSCVFAFSVHLSESSSSNPTVGESLSQPLGPGLSIARCDATIEHKTS